MNKLTGQEIIAKVKESKVDIDDFAWENYDHEELGLGEIEEIEQVGGEGEGDHWHSVKLFKDHDVYLKVVGYYASHDGTSFYGDCIHEVKPVERTVTFYE